MYATFELDIECLHSSLLPEICCTLSFLYYVVICLGGKLCYAVSVESVLQGHENWIYSIHWKPPTMKGL